MWDGRDIEEAGLKGYEGPAFSTDQLMYRRIVPRVNSPYGFSAVEMGLIVIMTGLRKQAYQLEYYLTKAPFLPYLSALVTLTSHLRRFGSFRPPLMGLRGIWPGITRL